MDLNDNVVKQSFQKLHVWQKSFDLTISVYKVVAGLPDSEKFGLKSQLRRAAVSIPSNIAEGYMRQHAGEYIHFLHIALASSSELLTQLMLTEKLIGESEILRMTIRETNEVISMLVVMVKKLKEKNGRLAIYPLPSTLDPASPGDANA